jgi:hypothetical protein
MLKKLLLSITFFIGLSSVILVGNTVYASSIYDDNYRTASNLVVGNTTTTSGIPICTNTAITANWSSYITDSTKWPSGLQPYYLTVYGDMRTSFLNAINDTTNGAWAVSQTDLKMNNGKYAKGVVIFWTQDPDAELDWTSYPGQTVPHSPAGTLNRVIINCSGPSGSAVPAVTEIDSPLTSYQNYSTSSTGTVYSWGANYSSNLLTHNFDFSEQDGYDGEHLPSSPPAPRKYVALGDSFSSGEGNPSFEAGTDIDSGVNKNLCHRSPVAYPRVLETKAYLNLTNFVACAGATTTNITNSGQWGEDRQIDALSQSTDIVTLTIGGNNVGFGDFATACTVGDCHSGTQVYADISTSITSDLPSKLADTYEAVDNATSNDADIYVLGYPDLSRSGLPDLLNSTCTFLNGGSPGRVNSLAVYEIESLLNTTIQQAVSDYGSSKFHYINPNVTGSPFEDHDLCSMESYFNALQLPPNIPYTYHPNTAGHNAYSIVMQNIVN